ncbi:hypothetical protein [Vulgatibacter sp.]|uniref:hypothetical protein n=1 Tax=Vulgatibacter sp. TaxID=1971226 RepID=UPI003568817C
MNGGTCGLWMGPRALVAAVVGSDGRVHTVKVPRTDDAREGLVAWLVAGGVADMILPDTLLREDSIGRVAIASGLTVWTVSRALVEPLRLAAGISAGRSSAIAALLARMQRIPSYRAQLRRMVPPDPGRQLRLL